MTLSKMEIQQMLREMNVKFDAADSYDVLKQRLQQENHNLWLKSVSGNRPADSTDGRRVVRKRRHPSGADPETPAEPPAVSAPTRPSPASRSADASFRSRSIDKPKPGKPWKAAAEGTEPFNRKQKVFESVLRRAGHCCERCGIAADATAEPLTPFYIQPLAEGGEHSIKNVVALCPTCRDLLKTESMPKELKELKRKTRARLYDTPKITRKKPSATRRRTDRRSRR